MKFLVLLILLCSSNNYSVELILKDGPLGSGQIYIPCTIDFILYECFFDSGAKESLVSLNEFERYKKIGEYNMGGAAGVGKKYDEIVVKDVRLGEFSKLNYKVGRSQDDFTQKLMIGSSFFIDQSLFFNFKENEITPHVLLNSELDVYPLKTFGGRPLVDVNVGGSKLNGVWDTGAGLTTVDQDYIDKNPSLFEFIQVISNGVDSTGSQISLKLYRLKSFSILQFSFEDVHILGMDFSLMRKLGVPKEIKFIIGYNTVIMKNWYFDFKNLLWTIEDK